MWDSAGSFVGGITSGSWPDWLAAIGTTAAFAVAAIAYARDVRDRRWAQARLVYTRLASMSLHAAGDVMPMPGADVVSGTGNADWVPVDDEIRGRGLLVVDPTLYLIVAVHNGSAELLTLLWVEAIDNDHGNQPWPIPVGTSMAAPGKDTLVALYLKSPGAPRLVPSFTLRVTFRDAAGRWWQRTGSEPIQRVRKKSRRHLPLV